MRQYARNRIAEIRGALLMPVTQERAKRAYVRKPSEEPQEPAPQRLASQLADIFSRWNDLLENDRQRDPLDPIRS